MNTPQRVNRAAGAARETASRQGQQACGCAASADGAFACPRCRAAARLSRRGLGPAGSFAPPIVHDVLAEPGAPLDGPTQSAMRSRLGHDFARVRVHTGARAEASAQAVDALAYTVGAHLVFGRGQGPAGDDALLVHELAHVVQQAGTAYDPAAALPLEPEGSPAEHAAERAAQGGVVASPAPGVARVQRRGRRRGTPTPRPPTITTVDVDQSTPQRVSITWSDGRTESDTCSTGKGHCCLDESAAEGAACSEAGSRAGGSNCTPVGSFVVTTKIPVTAGGVRLWTQFHDSRSIALHEYRPVDGTPLSHGCVRLNEAMARRIFGGAVVGRTRVRVRNLARPRCDHPALQREWVGDFREAGSRPPDGDAVNFMTGRRYTRAERRRIRRHIDITRGEMRSALGVDSAGLDRVLDELNRETGGLATSTADEAAATLGAVARRIPRCVPTVTTEEARVPDATAAGLAGTQSRRVRAFERAMRATGSQRVARRAVERAGRDLWEWATGQARAGAADDRLLYWTRLEMARVLRSFEPAWLRPPAMNPDRARRARLALLDTFERASRGMDTAGFTDRDADIRRVVVAGFDPFGLSVSLERGNPSAAAALALDNQLLGSASVRARVQAAVFPVRYADFDEGLVERFFGPFLSGARPARLIMTISMGGSADLELEEFAGRRRSTATGGPENLGRPGGGTPDRPRVIPGAEGGPEFLRTNVPSSTLGAMRGTLGRSTALPGETTVREIPAGRTQPRTAAGGPTRGSTAVEGSGGGFLSNEIFYRVRLLQRTTQSGEGAPAAPTLVIHLHTPLLPAPTADTRADFERRRGEIVARARQLIEAALPTL
jgi:hypothetical protein